MRCWGCQSPMMLLMPVDIYLYSFFCRRHGFGSSKECQIKEDAMLLFYMPRFGSFHWSAYVWNTERPKKFPLTATEGSTSIWQNNLQNHIHIPAVPLRCFHARQAATHFIISKPQDRWKAVAKKASDYLTVRSSKRPWKIPLLLQQKLLWMPGISTVRIRDNYYIGFINEYVRYSNFVSCLWAILPWDIGLRSFKKWRAGHWPHLFDVRRHPYHFFHQYPNQNAPTGHFDSHGRMRDSISDLLHQRRTIHENHLVGSDRDRFPYHRFLPIPGGMICRASQYHAIRSRKGNHQEPLLFWKISSEMNKP